MPATLVDAIRIAVNAHGDELDLNGEPYVLHPLRVMMAQQGEEARMAAVLHDVIEDTPVTLEDLAQAGFSETVLEAVSLLTKDPELSYKENIARIKDHPLARSIKLADLQDNMDIRRIPEPTKHDLKRLKKYRAAWTVLMEAAREEHS